MLVACGGRASRTVILTVADDIGPSRFRPRCRATTIASSGGVVASWRRARELVRQPPSVLTPAMSIAPVQSSSGMSAVSAGAIVPANDARQSSARSRAKVVHLSVTFNKDDKQECHHTNDHAPASSRSCGLFTKWSRSAGHGVCQPSALGLPSEVADGDGRHCRSSAASAAPAFTLRHFAG